MVASCGLNLYAMAKALQFWDHETDGERRRTPSAKWTIPRFDGKDVQDREEGD